MPATKTAFLQLFRRLKGLLTSHAGHLDVRKDEPDEYYLDTAYSEKWKKPLFFGAVQIRKSYVSYHLFPVYMYPDLLTGMSDDLRKRMQGKSCFNFTSISNDQLAELGELTDRSLQRMKKEGLF